MRSFYQLLHTLRFRSIFLFLSFLFLASLIPESVQASHMAGMNITYKCIGSNQYEVTTTIYRDCSGIMAPTSLNISYKSVCSSFTETVPVDNVNGIEVSALCPQEIQNSTCNGGGQPGFQRYEYIDTVTLSSSCGIWNISTSINARNPSTNITGGAFYVDAELNSNITNCNNSPNFNAVPEFVYLCANQAYTFQLGAQESDGDSLYYALDTALTDSNNSVTYINPYTALQPITGITIDSTNGSISVTPTVQGVFIVVVKVKEYNSNGDYLGFVKQDYQFVISVCSNANPDISSSITNVSGGILTDSNSLLICTGQNLCFDVIASDTDVGDTITFDHNLLTVMPGATVSVSGTNPATATICWTATQINGTQNFTISALDNNCPIFGFDNGLYDITVGGGISAGNDQTICGSQSAQLNAVNSGNYSWSVLSGPPIIVGTNFSCVNCPNPVATPSVTTTYIVTGNIGGICNSTDTVTVTVVPDFTISQGTNDLCSGDSTTLSVTITPSGSYSYSWMPSSNLNDSTIANPVFYSNIPGVYPLTLEVIAQNGCAKTENIAVEVHLPVANAGQDTNICLGDSLQLLASGGISYIWTPGIWLDLDSVANPKASPAFPITFVVQVTDSFNCVAFDSIDIGVDSNTYVSGTITQSTNQPLSNSKTYLIKYFPVQDSVALLDSTVTDNNGEYHFITNQPIVYVKATPDSMSYPNQLPTYYTNSNVFQGATAISIIPCDTVFANFSTTLGINPGGPGFIGGYVFQGAGKKVGVGDPVVALDLILIDSLEQSVKHAKTDNQGYFYFANIPNASYTIWVDHPPIDNQLGPLIEVGPSIKTDSLIFYLQPDRLELGSPNEITTPTQGSLGTLNIFPNPFQGEATIEYSLTQEAEVKLEVYNILGEMVMSYQDGKTSAGVYRFSFNTQKLGQPAGVYIARLRVNNTLFSKRLISIDKR